MTPISSTSSLPPSTQIINRVGEATQQNVVPSASDPSLVTPEEVNTAVDQTVQRANETQQAQADQREQQRSTIVQLNGQQQQQDQVDLYLSIATGEEVDSGSQVSAQAARETVQTDNQEELGLRQRQQQQVLDQIQDSVSDRPSIQPALDDFA